jgi:hypothetical protein
LTVGADGYALLDAVHATDAPAWLRQLPASPTRDARYGIKRGVGWRGYKAHFTETCELERPHLIVHVATTVATTADVETMPARHAELASIGLLPLVCLRSRPLGVARRRVVASIRGGSGGVGLDVGEHAAAVPAREGPDEP